MKIYTKTGDKGQTSLFGGDRVSKSNPLLCAYGTCDELNSILGLAHSELSAFTNLQTEIEPLQHQLFLLGSHLACGDEKLRPQLPELKTEFITHLEQKIDSMDAKLPALREFILPGGSKAASVIHLARTVCRRLERQLVELDDFNGHGFIIMYINRLSDFLFTFARYINLKLEHPDIPWKK